MIRRQLDDITVVDDRRWVVDGNLVTAGWVSAGIDMVRGWWARFTGEEHGHHVQHAKIPVQPAAAVQSRQLVGGDAHIGRSAGSERAQRFTRRHPSAHHQRGTGAAFTAAVGSAGSRP